ncbi:hypothetical protein CAPTEDRAFT_212378 [Capitella teleta]|uniref:Uncharacterized protein n=1 Tax=Capitella teleta TaxID=283909 RepID=R7URA1_CAPTE|nr:hypothetical protein CAPTEDRAFT_212378 [Capitella teleta]|eukprot:ELU08715.1 hypothetical protein CAPTEDRAFT_212378 [Capitella teleta]
MFDDKDKVPLVASEQRVKQEAVDTEPTQPMPALGNPSFKAPMSSSQHGLWNPLHKWIPSLPVPGLPLAPPLTTAASSLLMPPSAFPWSLVSPSHLKGTSPSSPQPASAPSTVTGSAPQSTRCPTEDAPPTPNESAYQEHVFPKMMLQSSQVHLRIADASRKSSSPDLDDIQDNRSLNFLQICVQRRIRSEQSKCTNERMLKGNPPQCQLCYYGGP